MATPESPEQRDAQKQKKWYERTRYQVLLFAGGIVLFGLVLWFALNSYIEPKSSTQKKDLVQALGLITAGVAGAVGIFITWQSQRLAREAQADNRRTTQEQLQNAQQELNLTRQGQMTERFTQAIEQLGSDKLEIKLGGIYSLERTAHEEKNYHWPVMEVLTSYVRRHAARKPEKKSRENAVYPEPDIQAILAVIGRRSEYHRIDEEVEYGNIELNGTDLQGADLEGAYLQGAILEGANLQGVKFLRARNLTQNQIEWTMGSNETQLPADLNRPELWSKSIEEQYNIIQKHMLDAD